MSVDSVNGKSVLVTGAGGFVGSHLTERLVGLGARVRAFVRYNSRNDRGLLDCLPGGLLKEVEVLPGDMRDLDAMRQACGGVKVVFHLGALIAIPYSYRNPREVIETNVLGTLNVLQAARDTGVERIIHTSTSEVYGTARQVPIDESHPIQGQSPYSASKIGADKLAESFYRSFGVPVCTLRPFNTYGPRQSARAVIPTIIAQALTGNEVYLGDLTPRRDLTYVGDTVEGFVRMAEATDEVLGQEINLGTGVEISIGDLAQKIFALVGCSPQVVSENIRVRPKNSEVFRLLADNRKAARLLEWKPKTSLDDGLRHTIQWVKQNLSRYRPSEYQT
jgi:dTDP-glucose 4,6-dehydratase